MDGFTWLRHREHRGYWRCPDAAVDDMAERGWEPTDPPPPQPDPAVAEQLAWRAEQAARTAATADPKPTKKDKE